MRYKEIGFLLLTLVCALRPASADSQTVNWQSIDEKNGIVVTALHNHLLNEQPRLFFMHFWANDDALRLARGLREALDAMN
jgi:hypothetical protein